MKPGQNSKLRMRGRMNNNGGKRHMPMRNPTYDSNGPDIRVRGNAHQVLEKYLAMARDASSQGDRIAAENYYQHAEHYFRTINAQNQQQQQPRFNNNGQNNNNNGQQRPMGTPADDHALLSGDMQGEDGDGQGDDEAEGGGGQTTPMNA
jgi:hypothetical protein